ncbi:MAG: TonB family protein [bacterium]|nr:TonB family protein [bacterium]
MDELKLRVPFNTKISFLITILGVILFCFFVPNTKPKVRKLTADVVTHAVELPQQMQQLKEPPPPPKPQMPVAAATDAEVEANTIDRTGFDTFDKAPVAPQAEAIPFSAVEVKPVLLNKDVVKMDYPELARKAEIEGTVFVRYIIDTLGNVGDIKVIKGVHELLDEAAVKTARQYKFSVARQRDKAVRVVMEQPIRFTLNK